MKTSKSYDKRTGITYVYEILENKWDPVKKRGVPKRRLIGRLNEDGELVPTGKRGRPKKQNSAETESSSPDVSTPDYRQMYETLLSKTKEDENTIQNLTSEIHDLHEQIQKIKAELSTFAQNISV